MPAVALPAQSTKEMDGRTSTPRDRGAEKVTRPRWRDSRRQQVTDREGSGVGRVREEAVEGVLMVGWHRRARGARAAPGKGRLGTRLGRAGRAGRLGSGQSLITALTV